MSEPIFYKPSVVGFVPYRPRKEAQQVLDHVGEVLETYRDSLPLTLRQTYYRLVGAYGYPKQDAFYQRLSTILARSRRAGLLPWHVIRDDGVAERYCGGGYDGLEGFRDAILRDAEWYSRSKFEGQPRQIIVLCEAAGMVPQIVSAVGDFPAIVRSAGGMDSVTAKHDLALLCARQDSVVLHVGDWDPSGLSIFHAIHEDVRQMAVDHCANLGVNAPEFVCKRVTIREEHISEYGLLTGTIKASDAAKRWYPGIDGDLRATCEAEALAPDDLQKIVRNAVGAEIDLWAFNAAVEAQCRERQKAIDAVSSLTFGDGGAS